MWGWWVISWFCHFIRLEAAKTDWDYYPEDQERCTYGIVMGGTSNKFNVSVSDRLSEEGYSTCIARLYAIHHGYAFVVHKDLGSLSNRTYESCSSGEMSPWNKVVLWQKYLPDVEMLIWLDLDALINDSSFLLPITKFLPSLPLIAQDKCLPRWNGMDSTSHYGKRLKNMNRKFLPGYKRKPFMFIGEDISPSYPINVNSAILVLRNVPKTVQFLKDVWNSGNDPNIFKRYDPNWRSKVPCTDYWGWPWEQGGIWETLSINPEKYLASICILSRTSNYVLNNVLGDPNLPILQPIVPEPAAQSVVFAYHHSKISGRYMLKRLMVRKYITSGLIKEQCKTFVAPPYHLTIQS